ncbi:leucine-responsive transcriptional regulator Lrp [Permianibacter aggregans]|uniref:Leucine-responsive regulatory protein n=1 Tax=Permianibacter aggregans TaxID=1510150 RepID=A0A4R6UNZ6_9GAMM|nr:leucine-responsive transcriptional regulator Lrp [Permianibacter aggregans]QGX38347.1 leucine-responsive transcriptional regulator Lrp [Permianibacter aggregans]TDQ48671.1 AsnC family transcriptional regulator [Permianibacter aggregans]
MRARKVLINQLDKVDRRILRELQRDGRLANVELAKRVGLSPTPCLERVKRLEDEGYIQGYYAKLTPAKLSAGLLVFVEIRLTRTASDVFASFKEAVVMLPQVLECHLVSGDFDYLIKARVADMQAYRKLLGETLLTLPHVAGSRSYVVMEEVKETVSIPIPDAS